MQGIWLMVQTVFWDLLRLASSVIAYAITASYFYLAITLAVMSFVVINITSSKIILGDLGAFGCSSMIALTSFQLYQEELVSLWMLACLLAYPCFEIVRVTWVRALNGMSPFSAGNDHLHNFCTPSLSTEASRPSWRIRSRD